MKYKTIPEHISAQLVLWWISCLVCFTLIVTTFHLNMSLGWWLTYNYQSHRNLNFLFWRLTSLFVNNPVAHSVVLSRAQAAAILGGKKTLSDPSAAGYMFGRVQDDNSMCSVWGDRDFFQCSAHSSTETCFASIRLSECQIPNRWGNIQTCCGRVGAHISGAYSRWVLAKQVTIDKGLIKAGVSVLYVKVSWATLHKSD